MEYRRLEPPGLGEFESVGYFAYFLKDFEWAETFLREFSRRSLDMEILCVEPDLCAGCVVRVSLRLAVVEALHVFLGMTESRSGVFSSLEDLLEEVLRLVVLGRAIWGDRCIGMASCFEKEG